MSSVQLIEQAALESWRRHADELPASADEDDAPRTVLEWADRYRSIDGHGFSLDRFRPLRHIYEHIADEDHKAVAIIKPAQRGVSELAVNFACFALDRGATVWTQGVKIGLNCGYVFSTVDALSDFVKERINGLVDESFYLARLFSARGSFDAIGFKQVRQSYLYLRGAKSQAGLKSFPADVLVLDEFDEMAPASIALARTRLGASLVKREIALSTPTIPGTGIHARWLQSDRNVYVQRCASCDAEVTPHFYQDVWADGIPWDDWQFWTPQRLRLADVAVHCPNCRTAWHYEQRVSSGVWRAEQPQIRSLRGYWIPALCWPQADLTELAVKAVSGDPTDQAEFARSDLGEPYASNDAKITEDMVASLDASLPGGRLGAWTHHAVTMGVDIGSRFHYRVSGVAPDGAIDILAMGAVSSWAELSNVLTRHSVRLCIVDALPEQHAAAEWQSRHRGRILRAFYPQSVYGLFTLHDDEASIRRPKRPGRPVKSKPLPGVIRINRSRAMDAVHAAISQHRERWPTVFCHDAEVIAHLTSPSRVVGQNADGQETIDWVHTKPDHYFHAAVYDLVARAALPPGSQGLVLAGGAHTQMAHQ